MTGKENPSRTPLTVDQFDEWVTRHWSDKERRHLPWALDCLAYLSYKLSDRNGKKSTEEEMLDDQNRAKEIAVKIYYEGKGLVEAVREVLDGRVPEDFTIKRCEAILWGNRKSGA